MNIFKKKNKDKVFYKGQYRTKEDAVNDIRFTYQNKIPTKKALMREYKIQKNAGKVPSYIHTNAQGRVRFVTKNIDKTTENWQYGNMIEVYECSKIKTVAIKDEHAADSYVTGNSMYILPQKIEINAIATALKDFIVEENYNSSIEAYEVVDIKEVVDAGTRWANDMWLSDTDEGREEALNSFMEKFPEFASVEYYDYKLGKCSLEDVLKTFLPGSKTYTEMELEQVNDKLSFFIREQQSKGKTEWSRTFDYSYRVLH